MIGSCHGEDGEGAGSSDLRLVLHEPAASDRGEVAPDADQHICKCSAPVRKLRVPFGGEHTTIMTLKRAQRHGEIPRPPLTNHSARVTAHAKVSPRLSPNHDGGPITESVSLHCGISNAPSDSHWRHGSSREPSMKA
ncbi:hypothetical protein G7046_g4549 [Stylonectria norvegica]|nr:hypothetical protein G7046_g4549 [Stylonectria norvegica]